MSAQQIHRRVWEALEVRSCPKLRELVLFCAKLSCDSAAALVSALNSGALSRLRHIDLHRTRWGDYGDSYGGKYGYDNGSCTAVVNVLNAMASSRPDLRHLNAGDFEQAYLLWHHYLPYIGSMGEQADTAIFDALREEKWPKLEKLKIEGHNIVNNECVFRLAGILEGGGGGNLRSLEVYGVPDDESVHVLGRVLHEGACPKLRSLYVHLREEGARATEERSCVEEVRALLRQKGIRVNRQ